MIFYNINWHTIYLFLNICCGQNYGHTIFLKEKLRPHYSLAKTNKLKQLNTLRYNENLDLDK